MESSAPSSSASRRQRGACGPSSGSGDAGRNAGTGKRPLGAAEGDAVGGVSIPLKRRVGAAAYLASTLTALRAKPPRLTARWNGGSAEGEWMCVGNGTMYGGPFTLFPDAKVNDGMLDLCVLPRVNSGVIARAVTAMLLGRLDHWPGVTYHRVREVTIEGPAGTRVQADGDFIGTLPMTITLRVRALRVLAPCGK